MTHTPGPWVPLLSGGSPRLAYAITGPNGRYVVNWSGIASPTTAESQANARLIVVAPEMLQFIKNRAAGGDLEALDLLAKAENQP